MPRGQGGWAYFAQQQQRQVPARNITRAAAFPFPDGLHGPMHEVGELLLREPMPFPQAAPIVGGWISYNERTDTLSGHRQAPSAKGRAVGAAPGRSQAVKPWKSVFIISRRVVCDVGNYTGKLDRY